MGKLDKLGEIPKGNKKTIIGTGLTLTLVITALTLIGYDITENTYYCPDKR
jgi:hypothetical protein